MRPLIVGEAPSRLGDPSKPITGKCGAKLAEFAGLTGPEFRRVFARMNLLQRWPGSAGKGTRWDAAEARRLATEARRSRFVGRRTVLLLGWRVAAAFEVRVEGYFVQACCGGATAIVVPHPSGVNRWYNEPANRKRMVRFMRRVARGSV